MTERRLPPGMTPRLLSRDGAAAYCGIHPTILTNTSRRPFAPFNLVGAPFGTSRPWTTGLISGQVSRTLPDRLTNGRGC